MAKYRSSLGSPINPTNLANTFKSVKHLNHITDKTIETYIGYLADAFMIEKSERRDDFGIVMTGIYDAVCGKPRGRQPR